MIRLDRVRLAIRFNSIFFPIDTYDLVQFVEQMGFSIIQRLPPITRLARLEMAGPLASKGNSILDINTERGILGIDSTTIPQVISDFNELESIPPIKTSIESAQDIRFYEAIISGIADTGLSPIHTMATLFDETKQFSQFSNIWGEKLTNFGVRLVRKGNEPNQDEWLEIKFEPEIRTGKTYIFEAIYRSKQKSDVVSFMEGFETKIEETLRLIERKDQ